MKCDEFIEELWKNSKLANVVIYPEDNEIAGMLCGALVEGRKLFGDNYITLVKKDNKFSVEIHTSCFCNIRSPNECIRMINQLGLFTFGTWRYGQYGPFGDPCITFENEEAIDGFVRLLKLYSVHR